MTRTFYLMLLLLLAAASEACAGIVKGRITDEKGAALPFSTVFIQGTTIGTTSNADGEYSLTLAAGSYKVVAQYIGFRQSIFSLSLRADEVAVHDFRLQEQNLQMKEVTVKATDEDPAYRIIRKAIAKRSEHEKQIRSFQSSVYLKAVLRMRGMADRILGFKLKEGDKKEMARSAGLDSNGKGVLYLCEELSDYYRKGDKTRTIVHSVRESGDPNGFGAASMPAVISFYENNINISEDLNPRGFISPIANGAIAYYKYKLLGEFSESGHIIYKIQVTPRRLYEPLFEGVVYIMDDEWGFHSLDLQINKKSGMELLDTLRIRQLYLPLKKNLWVIKSQVLYPAINVIGFPLVGDYVTVYDRQKVNEPIPDSIFAGRVIGSYDKDANKKDTAYWKDARLMQLQEDEARDFVVKDSTRQKLASPEFRDSVRRRGNRIRPADVYLNGVTHTGKDYKWDMRTNSLLLMTNYNTVEGLNLAPKVWVNVNLDTNKKLRGRAAVRYGFSNTHFNAIGALTYTQSDKHRAGRNWSLGVEGGKYVFQYNKDNPISPLYNTISTLLFRENFLKIYERWEAGLNFRQSLGNGFRWGLKAEYQQRLPLENTTDYTWAASDAGNFTGNVPSELNAYPWAKHNAVLGKAFVSYQPGVHFVQYPDRKVPTGSDWPTFTLEYEKGIPDLLDSKVDFDKWRFTIDDEVRLRMLGSLSYNISAGGFLNDKYVSLPDLKHLLGNRLYVASPYLSSFQLAPYYKFSNTASFYGEAHAEWYLKGLLTNKIPLLRQARWYLVAGTNSFYVNKDQYYAEGFLGIDNLGYSIFRVLRVDFVKGWDSYKESYTGIRIGIKPTGFVQVRPNDREGEW